jgi:hypothetical protein
VAAIGEHAVGAGEPAVEHELREGDPLALEQLLDVTRWRAANATRVRSRRPRFSTMSALISASRAARMPRSAAMAAPSRVAPMNIAMRWRCPRPPPPMDRMSLSGLPAAP